MSQLRVAFDHRVFAYQKHGGVSRYVVRLVQHLPQHHVTPKVIAPLHVNQYLRELPSGSVWGHQVEPSARATRTGTVLGELLHRPLARAFRADIVHETHHHFRRVAPTRAKVVATIYDLIFEKLPALDLEQLEIIRTNIRSSIDRADRVICISKNTQRDLLEFHPAVAGKTEVVLLGFDPQRPVGSGRPPHARPYILYVGMRLRYKNFSGLVAAVAASDRLRRDFDIVCVGGGAFSDEERHMLADAGLASNVFQRSAESDEELGLWYRHAQLFAYPSLYEGFGIPPLEAMAADCPVVCMFASSLPEVCGEAAEYAQPGDSDSLRVALERVAYSKEEGDRLRSAGRERLKLFSWSECAKQTAAIYKSLK